MRFVNDVLSVTQRSFLSHKISLKESLRYESFKPKAYDAYDICAF